MILGTVCNLGGSLGSFVVLLQIYNIRKWAGCWSVFIVFSSILHVSLIINSSFLLWKNRVPLSARRSYCEGKYSVDLTVK